MVFCGKPSKGCQTCRERKIRCDQAPDGCSQCDKVGRSCPGYRDQLDLMFRNESKSVVRKAKAKDAKSRQGSRRPSPLPSLDPKPADAISSVSGDLGPFVQRDHQVFPTLPPPTFSMAPTIEERATGFFFSNFVIGVRGPTRGHLDHLENVYNTDEMDDTLLASMKSVGLAGYSHMTHAPALMREARQEYSKALRLTNMALKSPKDVRKDSTLLSIMILGIFETVTGSNQRSLNAWAEHINGAAALVNLRGLEQLRTAPGRRLFIQVTSSLLISCIQRRLRLPKHIVELRAEAAKHLDPTETAWCVQECMIAFADFRYKTRVGVITDPQLILSKALEIDRKLRDLFAAVPSAWEYEIVYTNDDPDIVFNKSYHVYFDHWIAQLWNAMRTIRIMLNEQIRELLLQGLSLKPPLFLGPEYLAQLQASTEILYVLAADILASVPQHLGYVSRQARPTPTPSITLGANEGDKNLRFLWRDFKDSSPSVPWHGRIAAKPIIPAASGYFLLWPLFLVGCMNINTEPIRQWVVKNLVNVGRAMGIQQALVVAGVVERREDVEVWQEMHRRMSEIDESMAADLAKNSAIQ